MHFESLSTLEIGDVWNCLEKDGVLLLRPGAVAMDLAALRSEFARLLDGDHPGVRPIALDHGAGRVVERNQLEVDAFPEMQRTFTQPWMGILAERFWGEFCEPNGVIYVMHEVVGTTHTAQDLHFDVLPTLKFFLYLTDTTEENGAFACVPGSHRQSLAIRSAHGRALTYAERAVTRELPVEERDVVSVEGEAGSVIIFSTEVFHRAGRVSRGERCVMRGHTRPATV